MKQNMVHAVMTVDRRALRASPERIRHMVREKLIHLIADQIATEKVIEESGDFSTKFSISLVVKSPDEYYRDVQQAAMESSVGYPQFMEK